MANTKYILEKIKIEGELQDLLVKTNAENVAVTWNGGDTTLAAALTEIFTSLTELPTDTAIDTKISAAVGELVAGAPEAGDTLKGLFDLIGENEDAMNLLTSAIGDKVNEEEGKGLSSNDFTDEDKARLNGLRGVRFGTEIPGDLRDGELFVRVVDGE